MALPVEAGRRLDGAAGDAPAGEKEKHGQQQDKEDKCVVLGFGRSRETETGCAFFY